MAPGINVLQCLLLMQQQIFGGLRREDCAQGAAAAAKALKQKHNGDIYQLQTLQDTHNPSCQETPLIY